MALNPAFRIRKPEGRLIGEMLLAFGELEYILCKCAAENTPATYSLLRALYRINGTSARIDAADAFARETYSTLKMGAAYAAAIGALRTCLALRNQYAHCAWSDGGKGRHGGLYFADLSDSAEATEGWEHHWRHVNMALLKQQADYFEYAKKLLLHLELSGPAYKRQSLPGPPAPTKREPPKPHNSPERHIPRWLNATDKANHLARALAGKETVRLQQRAHRGERPQKPKKLSARQRREMQMKAARRARRHSP